MWARPSRRNGKEAVLSVTFVEVCIVLGVLGEGEAVCDFQPVLHHQAQQDALNHLAALALLLVVLDDLQHHLEKQRVQLKRDTELLQKRAAG